MALHRRELSLYSKTLYEILDRNPVSAHFIVASPFGRSTELRGGRRGGRKRRRMGVKIRTSLELEIFLARSTSILGFSVSPSSWWWWTYLLAYFVGRMANRTERNTNGERLAGS